MSDIDHDTYLHARGPGCAVLLASWLTLLALGFALGYLTALAVTP